jgi:copper(I)-binding protein
MVRRGLVHWVWGMAVFLGGAAQAAPLTVTEPWVRATVATQSATGMFMTLHAQEALRVVAARSPVARQVEFHEMTMEQDVMRMRARPALVLKAGQTLALRPGSWHVMLLGLSAPVVAGQTVPVRLTIETQAGVRSEVVVQALVRALHAPSGTMTHHAGHGSGH